MADRNAKYYDILNNEKTRYVKKYAEVLIKWTYDHIIYSRRRMIYNIMHLCDTYENEQTFKNQIDNYLRISEKTVVLDSIVIRPNNDWSLWLDAFYDISSYEGDVSRNVLKFDGFSSLHMMVARYLESYKDNTGLNWIYVISGIMCNDFDPTVDSEMLNACMNEISDFDFQSRSDFITGILEIVSRSSNKPYDSFVQVLSESVITYFPSMSQQVYEYLNDDYSLNECLCIATKQISTILEEQKW